MSRRARTGRSDGTGVPGPAALPALGLLATAFLLVYRPGPLQDLRNWGFHFALYVPLWAQILFWAGALTLALSQRARDLVLRGAALWGRLIAGPDGGGLARRRGDLIVPVALALLCWLLRARYALLGDNWLRLGQALHGERLPYEWGTMVLAHQAIQWGDRIAGWDARTSLAVLNTIAAIPFGAAAAQLARALGNDALGRGVLHLALLSLGAVQLFCGYIEVYSWAMAFLFLYLASLLRAGSGGSLLSPVVFLIAGIALHAIVILFAGAALAAAWIAVRRARGRDPAAIAPAALRAGALTLAAAAALSPFVAPELLHAYASPRAESLTLLDPALWWERANGFLLASVAGTLAGVPLLLHAVLRGSIAEARQLVLLAALLPSLLILGMTKMVLGAADWDIIAFAGGPLLLWSASFTCAGRPRDTTDAYREAPGPLSMQPALARWAPLLLFLSLANTWGFIAVNHGDASIPRLRDIVADDPAPYYRGHPPPLHLAFLFASNGLETERYAELRRGVEEYPGDPRMPYNLAAAHFEKGRLDEARRWALQSLATRSGYLPPVILLYRIATRRGDVEEQMATGEALLQAHAADPRGVERYLRPPELAEIRATVTRLSRRNGAPQRRSPGMRDGVAP